MYVSLATWLISVTLAPQWLSQACQESLPARVRVKQLNIAQVSLPKAPPQASHCQPLSLSMLGTTAFAVEFAGQHGKVRLQVSGELERQQRLAKLRRAYAAGEVIAESDIEPTELWVSSVGEQPIDPSVLVGSSLRAIRALPANIYLSRRDVEKVPVLFAKDQVRLVMSLGGVSASAPGEAQQPGAVGDWVMVVNQLSHRAVRGRVKDARTVEVQP